MTIQYYGYPKCTTCRKASKWLKDNDLEYIDNHIAENPPSKDLLRKMFDVSGLELKKFFNTSGMKYRELGLKDKLPTLSGVFIIILKLILRIFLEKVNHPLPLHQLAL